MSFGSVCSSVVMHSTNKQRTKKGDFWSNEDQRQKSRWSILIYTRERKEEGAAAAFESSLIRLIEPEGAFWHILALLKSTQLISTDQSKNKSFLFPSIYVWFIPNIRFYGWSFCPKNTYQLHDNTSTLCTVMHIDIEDNSV